MSKIVLSPGSSNFDLLRSCLGPDARDRGCKRRSSAGNVWESHVRTARSSALDADRFGAHRAVHLVWHPHAAASVRAPGIANRAHLAASHGCVRILHGFGAPAQVSFSGPSRIQPHGGPRMDPFPHLAYARTVGVFPPSLILPDRA